MTVEQVIRLAPLSGIVAVALQIVALVVGGSTAYRPRGDAASAIFTADPDRIQLGALIGGFYALVFLLIFVGSVAGAVRRSEGDGRLAYIALGGGLIAVVALAIGYRALNAAAFQAAGTMVSARRWRRSCSVSTHHPSRAFFPSVWRR